MNSMGEMQAEIAERDRARHERDTGAATVEDDFKRIEQQLKELQANLATTRHRLAHRGSAVPENGATVRRD
jgi:septal ring factor EnvC (AmiA/AmiB activator)